MIIGEASVTVDAPRTAIFEFVLDLERYRQADHKIGPGGTITWNDDGTGGTMRFPGRLLGLPAPTGTYPFTKSENSLRIGPPIAGGARWVLEDFDGSFELVETDDGVVATHREALQFRRPWRWLIDPLLRRWLANDTTKEMARFKQLVESGDGSPDESSSDAPATPR